VYAGLSRKSMIGTLTGRTTPADRAAGSAAAALIAVQRGARMVRVHDVAATVDALAVWQAVHAVDVVPRRDEKKPTVVRWPDDD
jgi:dihydropteroate synthase